MGIETIGWVVEQLQTVPDTAPSFTDQGDVAVDYWESLNWSFGHTEDVAIKSTKTVIRSVRRGSR